VNRKEFEKYLTCFNTRNYEEVMKFFSDDFTIKFAGYEIMGRNEFLDFYGFFHSMVDEQIETLQFAGDVENVIIDVNVRLEGLKNLTQSLLNEKGYERLVTLEKGEVKVIPQFIHYQINSNGKFNSIICVAKDIV
jgi:hypothetical protein